MEVRGCLMDVSVSPFTLSLTWRLVIHQTFQRFSLSKVLSMPKEQKKDCPIEPSGAKIPHLLQSLREHSTFYIFYFNILSCSDLLKQVVMVLAQFDLDVHHCAQNVIITFSFIINTKSFILLEQDLTFDQQHSNHQISSKPSDSLWSQMDC